MLFRYIAIFFLGTLLISSCKSSLYKPTLVEVTDTTEFNALQTGRNLYIRNCNNCHNLYLPSQYSSEKWKEALNEMQGKTKLSDTEVSFIYKYLTYKKQQIQVSQGTMFVKVPVK
jgi:hypothetical protein